MKKEEVSSILLKLIVDKFKLISNENINQNSNLYMDLGLTSIRMVELFLRIEQTFDIEFEDNDLLLNFETVGSLEELIVSKLSQK